MDDQHDSPLPRRRLGRGLDALLGGAVHDGGTPHEDAVPISEPPNHIHVELIDRNPFQPRKEFEADGLKELAESIRQRGILQPILVRQFEDHYQLIAGERRLIAARQVGLETVPCRVVAADDRTVCEIALDENLKRRDLNVLEKAQAFRFYLEHFQCTIEDLAGRMGLDRSTVSNMLRLLELPEAIRLAVADNRISAGHARALLVLPEPRAIELCQRIQDEGLSVRATETAVKVLQLPEGGNGADVVPMAKPGSPQKSNHVLDLERQLQEQFGVRVEIKLKKNQSGQIVLHFASNDEFEGIVQRVRRAA